MLNFKQPGEPLVELRDFVPENKSLDLLEDLEAAGICAPVLFGGAVRDDYMRQKFALRVPTHDYDIRAGIDVFRILQGATDSKSATRHFENWFEKKFPGLQIVREARVYMLNGAFSSAFFTLIHQGREISLHLDNAEIVLTREQRLSGFAPLCYIGADSTGKVLAHEKFEEHARQSLFAPFKTTSEEQCFVDEKFFGLAKKIPGLVWTSRQHPLPTVPRRAARNVHLVPKQ